MARNNSGARGSNYYDILGVTSTASADDIRSAYRKAAKANHPDLGGDPALMLRINEAYAILKDDKLRADYDMHLQDQDVQSDRPSQSEPFAEAETERERAAFFDRIEQIRFAVQNEYDFLRSATLRSLAIYTFVLVASIILIGVIFPKQGSWQSQDMIRISAMLLAPVITGLFSLYVLLTQTAPLLVRPFQFIYECALLDEHISYTDKDMISAILADMIDTKRKQRVETIRSIIPKAYAALKHMIKKHT